MLNYSVVPWMLYLKHSVVPWIFFSTLCELKQGRIFYWWTPEKYDSYDYTSFNKSAQQKK